MSTKVDFDKPIEVYRGSAVYPAECGFVGGILVVVSVPGNALKGPFFVYGSDRLEDAEGLSDWRVRNRSSPPDLLVAVRDWLTHYDACVHHPEGIAKIRAAIAAAEAP